ncbi:hypothetical protein [Nitrobacter sp.]|uniref:hypothetical protein n=1 Tax=Nitrobacter sp. TaxID=29420 RepID=UPI0029CAC255|nr:hypothetical protein [Nitrobacter sp.]
MAKARSRARAAGPPAPDADLEHFQPGELPVSAKKMHQNNKLESFTVSMKW